MAIEPTEWIWHAGQWCRWQDATVHITTHALHYGSSAFEGVRCYETTSGPAIFRLGPHVERLLSSAKLLRMDLGLDAEQISEICLQLVARNQQKSCYIRPLAYRGAGTMGLNPTKAPAELSILCFPWGSYLGEEALETGIDVGVSSWRRFSASSMMPMGKIGGQYINNQLASVEAKANGFAEAIMVDDHGRVAEGAGQNLFLVQDGVLITPPTVDSILEGITRNSVLQLATDLGIPTRQASLPREQLYLAEEMFLTGTASEVTPVRSVDRLPVGDGRPGPITQQLQKAFFDLLAGRAADPHGWLQAVPPID